jgi:hypothetical protein
MPYLQYIKTKRLLISQKFSVERGLCPSAVQ